jgi:hypothetical protein
MAFARTLLRAIDPDLVSGGATSNDPFRVEVAIHDIMDCAKKCTDGAATASVAVPSRRRLTSNQVVVSYVVIAF